MTWRKAISAAILAALALAQENTRRSWDANFLSHRPATPNSSAPRLNSDDAYLGVTVWRLRLSQPSDNPGIRVQLGVPGDWTADRVSEHAPLSNGAKFRITVESARAGYLYVIRSRGIAEILYPSLATAAETNYVTPGTVVVVPSPKDPTPHFQYAQGDDLYTVLVTPHPIPGIKIGPGRNEIPYEEFADWKIIWSYPVTRLATMYSASSLTQAEAEAMNRPTRPLTQSDSTPQDLYRSEAPPGEPIVIDIAKSLVEERPRLPGSFSGIIGRTRAPTTAAPVPPRGSRVTAGSFLTPEQNEAPGYGLYSYVLFGERPESLDSTRWRRYFQTILAFFNLPPAESTVSYVAPAGMNLTFFPITCAQRELPKSSYQPIAFQFDPERVKAHAQEHQASGKPFAGHGASNADTACTLVSSYDYSRAQQLLALLPGPHLEGPYIISAAQPLSKAGALPAQYLYQDLSSVPPELVSLWFKEFMAQAQEPEFWKTRTRDQFVLRLRTAIGIASQQVPDFGSTITWAFITAPRK